MFIVNNNSIEQFGITYDCKHKLEYNFTHNKSDNKLVQKQKTEQL